MHPSRDNAEVKSLLWKLNHSMPSNLLQLVLKKPMEMGPGRSWVGAEPDEAWTKHGDRRCVETRQRGVRRAAAKALVHGLTVLSIHRRHIFGKALHLCPRELALPTPQPEERG